jgi:hypothetical protein
MEWLTLTAKLRNKLARWSLILAEYDVSITHRPGKDNTVLDLLYRKLVNIAVIYGRKLGIAFHLARRASIPPAAMDYPRHEWGALIVVEHDVGCRLATHAWGAV